MLAAPAGAGYIQVISGGGGQSLYDFVAPEVVPVLVGRPRQALPHGALRGRRPTMRASASRPTPGGEVLDTFTLAARPAADRPAAAALARAIAADLVRAFDALRRDPSRFGICNLGIPGRRRWLTPASRGLRRR